MAGFDPDILSVFQKSDIPGSQHLQAAIPLVTPEYPDSAVTMIRMGTAEGYARKVYGDPARSTGWPHYSGIYRSWSVYKAYDKLWDKFEHSIINLEVTPDNLEDVLAEYDVVFSTLPRPSLCYEDHSFESVPFWILPMETPPVDKGREVVVFNGLPQDHWYRWSILGGKTSIETCVEGSLGADAWPGQKAISTTCDCWEDHDKFVPVGRWAKWQHGVLMHHAYNEADRYLMHYRYRRERV
jgi:hypothetical protein